MPLRTVIPITDWKQKYEDYPWMININPSKSNGLSKISAADAFQCKSFSINRFVKKIGILEDSELKKIIYSVGTSIGLFDDLYS